ncbi:hypothetical protein FLONG3_7235 [Fusarium longipes]|uniref:CCHC-type domain-containing protein n=1 Tax=Fusarium longipes TaxID=694270 RepID=A0A395SG74_9HYPO|nr:hypothetical protein FLONG3_7235 [Fusarium longipes]
MALLLPTGSGSFSGGGRGGSFGGLGGGGSVCHHCRRPGHNRRECPCLVEKRLLKQMLEEALAHNNEKAARFGEPSIARPVILGPSPWGSALQNIPADPPPAYHKKHLRLHFRL